MLVDASGARGGGGGSYQLEQVLLKVIVGLPLVFEEGGDRVLLLARILLPDSERCQVEGAQLV